MSVGSLVQVKTRTMGADGGWHMGGKHEKLVHERLFYAFVDLEPVEPRVSIIPWCRCAGRGAVVTLDMARVAGRGRTGTPEQQGQTGRPSYPFDVPGFPSGWMEAYRERWDYLEVDPEFA